MAIVNPSNLDDAHMVNVTVRRNGVDEHYEGDWLKWVPRMYPFLRHAKGCKAGTHCENHFCHHNGDCSCGLDKVLECIPGSPVQR